MNISRLVSLIDTTKKLILAGPKELLQNEHYKLLQIPLQLHTLLLRYIKHRKHLFGMVMGIVWVDIVKLIWLFTTVVSLIKYLLCFTFLWFDKLKD